MDFTETEFLPTLKPLTVVMGDYDWLYAKYQQQQFVGLSKQLIKVNVIHNPENNQTVEKQRDIANKLAQQIKHCKENNYKILLFTHSDYIIREFNCYITLNYCKKDTQERIMEKYGSNKQNEYGFYDIVGLPLIDKNDIVVYDVIDKNISKCNITKEYGVEVPSMSKVIVNMKKVHKDILFGD